MHVHSSAVAAVVKVLMNYNRIIMLVYGHFKKKKRVVILAVVTLHTFTSVGKNDLPRANSPEIARGKFI